MLDIGSFIMGGYKNCYGRGGFNRGGFKYREFMLLFDYLLN